MADSAARLRLTPYAGQGLLDGGWWPRTTSLEEQLHQLVRVLPSGLGAVCRITYSPRDWGPVPARIAIHRDFVSAVPFVRHDTHLVVLRTTSLRTLTLLVVPPAFSAEQGEEALLASLTFRNADAVGRLLHEVTDQEPHDEHRRWTT